MGWGTYNAQSMYRVRMLWLNSIDGNFAAGDMNVGLVLGKRIAAAAATRSMLMLPQEGVTDAYRLVNGEGDRLGGLVIDVYAGNFVVSSSARCRALHPSSPPWHQEPCVPNFPGGHVPSSC